MGILRGLAIVMIAVMAAVGCGDAVDISAPSAGQPGAATDSGATDSGATDSGDSAAAGADDAGATPGGSESNGTESGTPADGTGPQLPVDAGELPGLDDFEPSSALAPPAGWVLYAARADVSVPGGTYSFGGPRSACSLLSSADNQVILISNFQEGEIKNLAPYFGFTDRGDDFVIWGLYIGHGGERGQEWSGTGDGGATITATEGDYALIAPGGISFDPAGEGIEPDGKALFVSAEWTGDASENFTADEGPATISVGCLFVSSEIIDILTAAASNS